MTAPQQLDELAARYFADVTLKCWARDKDSNDKWDLLHSPLFIRQDVEYYVGHEPPDKRTITLTVNGREWVLPAPLKEEPKLGSVYWIVSTATPLGTVSLHWSGQTGERLALKHAAIHATAADAQAWADFNKWCRGGGV